MISSVGGQNGSPFVGAYAASKFALEGYSQSLRRELMLYGIDVIVIGPGAIATPIWDKADQERTASNSPTRRTDRCSEGAGLHDQRRQERPPCQGCRRADLALPDDGKAQNTIRHPAPSVHGPHSAAPDEPARGGPRHRQAAGFPRTAMTRFVLASASPRRLELLKQIGFAPMRWSPPTSTKRRCRKRQPAALAFRLARLKAEACTERERSCSPRTRWWRWGGACWGRRKAKRKRVRFWSSCPAAIIV